jgi:anti-sigma regulatory factor (Ser/Thr protein kinase)
MAEKFRTTKAAHFESLGAFRDFIETICQKRGIDSQTRYELKLAVDEACTNIITHGYANMNPGSIILDLELDSRQAIMRITDFGHPFEPCEPEAPDMNAALEDRPTSGFGLFIIYSTMDDVNYKTTEEGNSLILTKRLIHQEVSA